MERYVLSPVTYSLTFSLRAFFSNGQANVPVGTFCNHDTKLRSASLHGVPARGWFTVTLSSALQARAVHNSTHISYSKPTNKIPSYSKPTNKIQKISFSKPTRKYSRFHTVNLPETKEWAHKWIIFKIRKFGKNIIAKNPNTKVRGISYISILYAEFKVEIGYSSNRD